VSRRSLGSLAMAALLTVPWFALVASGTVPGTLGTVAVSGLAILGASFLLAWGAETAEKDVPRSFAVAVLAVVAVAPEYAVDALYAWSAGTGGATTARCAEIGSAAIDAAATGEGTAVAEACHDANLAIANMTGANRILIGIGWAGIAAYTVWFATRTGDPTVQRRDGWLADVIHIDRALATEMTFLMLATCWAFLVPLGGGVGVVDTLVLVGLYAAYILIVIRAGAGAEEEYVGVPATLHTWERARRIPMVLGLFLVSGITILSAVEPFAHGLEEIGVAYGLPEFFMIQWIAPLASESPELIIVAVLVTKSRSTAGFNTLISSKLNQWTLLVGTIAVIYSLGLGSVATLPFDQRQAAEIWITAAQSFFALTLLVDFRISLREALALFVLFTSQVAMEFAVLRVLPIAQPELVSLQLLYAYTAIYLVLGVGLLVLRRDALADAGGVVARAARTAMHPGAEPEAD
jgi:cation:H+ antiporter